MSSMAVETVHEEEARQQEEAVVAAPTLRETATMDAAVGVVDDVLPQAASGAAVSGGTAAAAEGEETGEVGPLRPSSVAAVAVPAQRQSAAPRMKTAFGLGAPPPPAAKKSAAKQVRTAVSKRQDQQ